MNNAALHFADQLADACQRAGAPICVGLDPVLERLPADLDRRDPVEAIRAFSLGVLEAVHGVAGCVKPQSACYERYGSKGAAVYSEVVQSARKLGFLVVGDVKRGDIGISAEHYAHGLLAGSKAEDDATGAHAITVNPYMGPDTLEPFVHRAQAVEGGLFVLLRTSNPGSAAVQELPLRDGTTVTDAVAAMIQAAGAADVGQAGYTRVGAVVGATHPDEARRLRERLPGVWFLLPGYGAQGGGDEGVRAAADEAGQGVLVTASRSVIYAKPADGDASWTDAVRSAAEQFRDAIATALG